MNLDVPLEDLLCRACREVKDVSPATAQVNYSTTRVTIPASERHDQVTVAVDVKSVELCSLGRSRYQARATAEIRCPCCAEVKELQFYLRAMTVLVSGVGRCLACDCDLEVTDAELAYEEVVGERAQLTVQARLTCPNCDDSQTKMAQVPSPKLAALDAKEGLKADLHKGVAEVIPERDYPGGPPCSKRFAVALSFPGERREYVSEVATALSDSLGREQVFYDQYFESELARFDLDVYLQDIYHEDAELIVVFLCREYMEKKWCGLEWRAIRDLIGKRGDDVMLMRFDHADIGSGVFFGIDGCCELDSKSPKEAADLILARLEIVRAKGRES